MDFKAIITLSTIIIIGFILYAIYNVSKKKKEANFLKRLIAFAEQNNCKIADHVRWNNSILGIDRERGHLFFIRKAGDKEILQQINLADIRMCRVNQVARTVKQQEGIRTVVDQIELIFNNIDKNKPDDIIEFYNTAYDKLFLSGEPEIADNWSRIINVKIAELPKTK